MQSNNIESAPIYCLRTQIEKIKKIMCTNAMMIENLQGENKEHLKQIEKYESAIAILQMYMLEPE